MTLAQYIEMCHGTGLCTPAMSYLYAPANPGLRTGGNLLNFLHSAGPCCAQAGPGDFIL